MKAIYTLIIILSIASLIGWGMFLYNMLVELPTYRTELK